MTPTRSIPPRSPSLGLTSQKAIRDCVGPAWHSASPVYRSALRSSAAAQGSEQTLQGRKSLPPSLRRHTGEVSGFVYASRALIASDLWIRAERPGAGDVAALNMRTGNLRGGLAFLDPVHYDRKPVDGATAGASAAVEHARHHEQAVKVARFGCAEALAYGAVVLDSRLRVHLLIGPARVLHKMCIRDRRKTC